MNLESYFDENGLKKNRSYSFFNGKHVTPLETDIIGLCRIRIEAGMSCRGCNESRKCEKMKTKYNVKKPGDIKPVRDGVEVDVFAW